MELPSFNSARRSAFAYAALPFDPHYADDYSAFVASPPTVRNIIPLPLDTSDHKGLRADSVHSQFTLQEHLQTTATRKTSQTLFPALRRQEIHFKLMRCQVLQRAIQRITEGPCSAESRRLQLQHAENMRSMTLKARQLAETLDGTLQARVEFWAARACIATITSTMSNDNAPNDPPEDDIPGALQHLKRAKLLDESATTAGSNGAAMTPEEKQEFDALLNVVRRAEANRVEVSSEDLLKALHMPQRGFTAQERLYIQEGASFAGKLKGENSHDGTAQELMS